MEPPVVACGLHPHDQAGNRVKQFLHGVKVEELPENKVSKDEEGD